jgi:hypothetical protein
MLTVSAEYDLIVTLLRELWKAADKRRTNRSD